MRLSDFTLIYNGAGKYAQLIAHTVQARDFLRDAFDAEDDQIDIPSARHPDIYAALCAEGFAVSLS